ncbi:MAG TPA: gfo/Idh/MocA family oxidoreductase, partial [SAR324 cluster bacterium]|nr:gfo/Idh/MocA family oxidoreductase [SAR324 cluster bacterium]
PDGKPDWNHPMRRKDLSMPLEDAYIVQCRHFCKVIRKQEKPRITAEDATRTLAATLAVFEASESGKLVCL